MSSPEPTPDTIEMPKVEDDLGYRTLIRADLKAPVRLPLWMALGLEAIGLARRQ